jgi:hypothetical protein
MEKWLCWGAIGVAGLLLVLFLLDLVMMIADTPAYAPFGGVSGFIDVISIIGCGLLLYISFDALREVR